MTDIQQWNQDYGITNQLNFSLGKGDMPIAEISNDLCQASIGLQGAHVLGFQAKGEEALIWMSPEAVFAAGKSLRGGVPICWPWFGPHASDASLPGHGPARTVNWVPIASTANADGSTLISFEMAQSASTVQLCAHQLRVQLHVTMGNSLNLVLETTNLGLSPFTLGQALHTYFSVGDVSQAYIEGLDGCEYIDKMDEGARKQQSGQVNITSETDRIYLGTSKRCEVVDVSMRRKIIIRSDGSASTVVWNPWIETAQKMGDLGQNGYLKMLCVETSNAADDVVSLAAGSTHRLEANYSSLPL